MGLLDHLIVPALAAAVAAATTAQAQQRDYRDRDGRYVGSSFRYGTSTSYTDQRGRFVGTVVVRPGGEAAAFDRSGRFLGTSKEKR